MPFCFFAKCFSSFPIGRKSKGDIEVQRTLQVEQSFFQYKINNCTILQDIFTHSHVICTLIVELYNKPIHHNNYNSSNLIGALAALFFTNHSVQL